MAYVSYGVDRGDKDQPQDIHIGTDDGGAAHNVTLCYDLTASLTTEDIILACQAFIRRLEGSEGSVDALNI